MEIYPIPLSFELEIRIRQQLEYSWIVFLNGARIGVIVKSTINSQYRAFWDAPKAGMKDNLESGLDALQAILNGIKVPRKSLS